MALAKFVRDRALVLDRQIRNAAPRIELVGRGERRGRADLLAGIAGAAMIAVGVRRDGRSDAEKIAPRNSQEPNSRETRLVCLPCQPSPAACASGFSITAAVSTNTFTSSPDCRRQPSRQHLQPLLDDVVIVVALRVSRDRAACACFENIERIFIGAVIDAEHDDRTHAGPQHARIHAPFRIAPRASPCRHGRRRRGIRGNICPHLPIASGSVTPMQSKPSVFASRASAALRSAGAEFDGLVQKSRST